MTSALGVPAQFFSLPVTETYDGFFRLLRRTSVSHQRRARALAHIAHDLAVTAQASGLPPVRVPQIPVTGCRLPAGNSRKRPAGAASVRHAQRPSSERRRGLEKHGILLIRLPLDTADVDAFSLPFMTGPSSCSAPTSTTGHDPGSTYSSRARAPRPRRPDLGHERSGAPGPRLRSSLPHARRRHPRRTAGRADWPVLFQLKHRWQVPLAALLMRARTLGRMSENNYLTAVKATSARGWRRVEPVRLGRPEHPTCLKQLLATPAGRQSLNLLPHDVCRRRASDRHRNLAVPAPV